MEAVLRRSGWVASAPRLRAAWQPLALIATLAAVAWAAVIVSDPSPRAIDGRSSSVWMSGERAGRIVLSPPNGERPSIAVQIGAGGAAGTYDVVDAGRTVLVADRSTGDIVSVDTRSGAVRTTVPGPVPPDARATLVDAGDEAYLVDPTAGSVRHVDGDGVVGAERVVDGGFTDWAATDDGVLWLVDDTAGTFTRVGDADIVTKPIADPGTGLSVIAIGDQPVVIDPSSTRLRWIREDRAVDLGASLPGADEGLVVQGTDLGARCVTVVTASDAACLTPDGPVRTVRMPRDVTADAGVQVFADDRDVVIASSSSSGVDVVGWDGNTTTFERSEPSGRLLLGGAAGGSVVVDDPGAVEAFSVTRHEFQALDKFSKRTVVINGSDTSDTGLGTEDDNAQVAGAVPADAPVAPAADDGKNDPPTAVNDAAVTRTGRSVTVSVLANDTDPENDPLSIVSAGPMPASDGAITVLRGTTVNYEPPPGSNDRSISFPYTVADTGNLDDSATVTIEVIGSGRNTKPTVVDDEATTPRDRGVDVRVTDNDSDAEGDPLSVVDLGAPSHGTAAIAGQGSVRYEPAAGFVGADTFTYSVADGYGGSATGTVSVEVTEATGANRPPVAVDDRGAAQAGQRVNLQPLLNDSDPDGDPITILGVTPVSGLQIDVVDQRVLSVTPEGTVGGLITFDYTIADPSGAQDTARVALFVQRGAVGDPPVAIDDQAVSASVAVTIEVTANDIDPAEGQLAVDGWTQPAPGTGSTLRASPSAILFTPAPGFTGTARFDYTVKNLAGLVDTGTVVVQVTPGSGSAPVARPDVATIYPGDVARVDALGNDFHPDKLPFAYAGPPTVRSGTATIGPDGWITFTPPNTDLTTYVVSYAIRDTRGLQSRADITITVVARPLTNSAPVANPDLVSTQVDTPILIDVLGNDTDIDKDPLTVVSVTTPTSGSASVSGGGVRFVPEAGTGGSIAAMDYTVRDSQGNTAVGSVAVLITAPAKVAPITRDDLVALTTGQSQLTNPTANDIDPDGTTAALTVTAVGNSVPAGVTATLSGRSVRLVAGSTTGLFNVGYTVTDADGLTANGTIVVVVQAPPNHPPVANDESYTNAGTTALLNVLDNDTDPDGGTLTLTGVSDVSPSNAGAVAISGARLAFSPASGYTGPASFTYTVSDDAGASATGTVTISVTACAALPSLSDVSTSTKYGTPVTVSLFGGGAPPAGTTVELGTPSEGSATLVGSTSVRYVPDSSTNGQVTIPWSLRNTCGGVASATVNVLVNQSPLASNDVAATRYGVPVAIDVRYNDTDPDGDQLTVSIVADKVDGGTASVSAGNVVFTPTIQSGTGHVTYRVTDPAGSSSLAIVTITITPNQAPEIRDGSVGMDLASATSIGVDVVDRFVTDPEGDAVQLLRSPISSTPGGASVTTVVVNGVRVVRFSTTTTGSYTIGYTVQDAFGAKTSGTFTIIVSDSTPPPTTTEPPPPPTTTEPPPPPTTQPPPTTTDPPPTTIPPDPAP